MVETITSMFTQFIEKIMAPEYNCCYYHSYRT